MTSAIETVTFPITFSTTCYAIASSYTGTAGERIVRTTSITLSGFAMTVMDTGGSTKNEAASWLAIGV